MMNEEMQKEYGLGETELNAAENGASVANGNSAVLATSATEGYNLDGDNAEKVENLERATENDYYEFKKALDDMNAELNAEKVENDQKTDAQEASENADRTEVEKAEQTQAAEPLEAEKNDENFTAEECEKGLGENGFAANENARSEANSEEEKRRYKTEFNAFKYEKYMSSVDYDMTGAWTVAEVKGALERAKVYKFSTCAVSSDKIKDLKPIIKEGGYKICVLCAPAGGCALPVIKKEIAYSKWYGASEFEVNVPLSVIKTGKRGVVKKTLKSLKSAVGSNKVLKVSVDFSALTADETRDFVRSAIAAKVDYIVLRGRAAAEMVTAVRALAGGGIKIEAAREVRAMRELTALLDSGVDKVYVKGTPTLADDIHSELEKD